MKLYVTSDIHLEYGDCVIENKDNADVLILGGDIMLAQVMHDHQEPSLGRAQTFRDFLKRCSFQFPHVIYVAGNHEFYNGNWPIGIEYLREECAKFPNIYFMENDCKTIDDFDRQYPLQDVQFLGQMSLKDPGDKYQRWMKIGIK